MSRTLGSRTRVISCEIHVCASAKSRSLRDFNRSPNSIAYSKAFQANRLRNIGRRRASPVGVGRIPMARRKKPEQMRSQLFGFLRILAIRVAFEANSMGAR